MAGEWIIMRTGLASEKHAIFVRQRCGLSADEVVGKLHRFWSWADGETEDGSISGISLAWINEYVGSEGFAEALVEFPNDPWLVETSNGIQLPNYHTYNGRSARKRLLDNRRKASARQADKTRTNRGHNADAPETDGGQKAPKNRTRSTSTEDLQVHQDQSLKPSAPGGAASSVSSSFDPERHAHKEAMGLLGRCAEEIGLFDKDGKPPFGWFAKACQARGYELCSEALRRFWASGQRVYEVLKEGQTYQQYFGAWFANEAQRQEEVRLKEEWDRRNPPQSQRFIKMSDMPTDEEVDASWRRHLAQWQAEEAAQKKDETDAESEEGEEENGASN